MIGIQALNIKSKIFLLEETVLSLVSLYECDRENLKHELHQARRVVQRKAQCGNELSSVLEFTIFIESYKKVLSAFLLMSALPVSSASCERSFSMLKFIKIIFKKL